MKLPIFAALLALLSVVPAFGGSTRFTGNKSVTVDVTVRDSSAAAGGRAELLFSFAPVAGIHINLKPALEFTLDSASQAALSGALVLPKGGPYLNTKEPVVQRVALSTKAKPGPLTLKGTLTYFFCSDKEGWCSKYKQPVEIALTVRR